MLCKCGKTVSHIYKAYAIPWSIFHPPLFQIISDDRSHLCFGMVVHSSDQVETQCSGVISNEEPIYNVNGYEYMDIQSEMNQEGASQAISQNQNQASSLAMNIGSHS